ncbi:ABC transporter permease [Mucilaginibacter gossypii]|uniref:Putative ABC transport system permease protein n=1 Tax=Mucilaginibacter gossypii TaxID=551996 RepID=A0A1G8AEF3_9SPHI|nr:ABC transporter permease [Mucilaginibacter gossypii]SDH19395.1 putative ABC transport system permease protein [Mucilaginibacter gossypii]
MIFTGFTVAMLLWSGKRINSSANRYLSLVLSVTLLHAAGLPLSVMLAWGPLLYFYFLQLIHPGRTFQRGNLWHFGPLVLLPVVPGWIVLLSMAGYLCLSHQLIRDAQRSQQAVLMDRQLMRYRRLDSILKVLLLLTAVYWLNDLIVLGILVVLIWIGFSNISASDTRPEQSLPTSVPQNLRDRGRWLKKVVAADRLYEDAELSLTTLAEKLDIHPHELSRIINQSFKKNFNDFINELRIQAVIRKLHHPDYERYNLLGIAYDSGFNSKSTFNRFFKELTGQTPAEHKRKLKKEVSNDKLTLPAADKPVILPRESTWVRVAQRPKRKSMIRNYLKTAYRSLQKNIGFTLLNIFGLSAGLATFLLIVFYVTHELGYDKYNEHADRIYRIGLDVKLNGNANQYATSEEPLPATIKGMFPEIEQMTRMIDVGGLFLSPSKFYIRKGNENIQEKKIVFTESSLFKVFTLPMIEGSPANALDAPHSAVITESTARKYFNRTTVVGQTLTINDTSAYKITGVIKDIPEQSHFHYDFFLSYSSRAESAQHGWGYGGMHNYLLLKPRANVHRLEKEIAAVEIKNSFNPAAWSSGDNYFRTVLMPITDIHLRDQAKYQLEAGSNIQYVYIFSVIAIFILLIACVNFMNLSTARSANRTKEVGVRKVLGSSRKFIIVQFLTESMLVTVASAFMGALIAWLLLPMFNQLAAKQLALHWGQLVWLVPTLLLIALVVGFLAGAYPAFFLSAFQPIDVLKGKIANGFKGSFLRSFLVVFQFSISIFLIISTLVIFNQLQFIRNKSLGFDRSHVLVIKNSDVLGNSAALFKNELKQIPEVENVSMSAFQPTGDLRLRTGLFPSRLIDIKQVILTEFWPVDEDYIHTMRLTLASGRNFSKDMPTDSAGMIVNEAFVRKYGAKDPLNKTLYRDSYGIQPYHIVGVVKDFHYASLHEEVMPLALYYAPDNGAINVRLRGREISNVLALIEKRWKHFSPNEQFTYSFMDADFDSTYRAEQRAGTIFLCFSTLAILIACLGLFGLAAYAAEQRTKEIGIRKVLGASVSKITGMLSVDFLKLVVIALFIATPLAWWAMQKWLQGFAYRTTIQWYLVAAAAFAAISIALITISFQSIRAALANPVDSLRNE